MSNSQNSVPIVSAVVTAMEILDCFPLYGPLLSLTQLCEKTGQHKSRVHRLCHTLVETGHLIKVSRSHYRLGAKLVVLGRSYEETDSLRTIAEPRMEELARLTGESVTLFVLDGMMTSCKTRVMGNSRLNYRVTIGESIALHPTAAGRVLLAYSDEQLLRQVLSVAELEKFTPNSVADKETLRAEIALIRKRGYAVDHEGWEIGISAIAAPILDYQDKIVAALGMAGPVYRFGDEERQKKVTLLKQAAKEISKRLGGEGGLQN